MNTEAKKERLKILMRGLQECGVTDAVLMFEMPTDGEKLPHIVKLGSPMACMALAEWAASYQHEQVYEGLEVTTWYDEDEDEV
jgi:hypothetical protein